MPLPIHCPLCNADSEHQSVITHHTYGDTTGKHAFFKCAQCDVVYLFPQLTPEQEQQFYAKEFEGFMNARSGEIAGWSAPDRHIHANQQQFNRRWEYLRHHLPPTGSLLEFGCSSGFMLLPLKEKGYQCFGIEPSGYFSEYVRSQGITVFENVDSIEQKFDVIIHYFVLEHIRDPLEFIHMNLELLENGGKLIIEIPNAADPLYTVYNIDEFEKFYWSIAHHWYFTEQSATYILNKIPKISYKLIRDQRYDLSNHIIWARDGKPGGMGRFSSKLGTKLDNLYKEALIESGNCDTLILIIEKDNQDDFKK
jgi:SAM-dependent methyltransferase